RIEAVNRIQDAASGLMERMTEIEDAERNLTVLEQRLLEITAQLVPQGAGDEGAAAPDMAQPQTEPLPLTRVATA
ncbi:MAG TPA: dynamin family protein, partial [Alicycliphilus sp.]|nr:dynamin family protein [Alicycliphilus sp.]